MSTYMAVRPFIVASPGHRAETCYQSDLRQFEDRGEAISHGFETLAVSDDFLIVTLNDAGEIKAVGWMEEDRPGDTPGLDFELIEIGRHLCLDLAPNGPESEAAA